MEADHLPDQQLEAMLNKLKKRIPNIKCPSGNKIDKLCVNLKCKSAMRCGDSNCKDCGKALHKTCGNITLKDITEVINQRAQKCRQFMMKIFKVEQQFIDSLRRNQQRFLDQFGVGISEEKNSLLIKKIYEAKQYQIIPGEDVQNLCQALQIQEQRSRQRENYKIQSYSKKLHQILNELDKFKTYWVASHQIIIEIDSKLLQLKNQLVKDCSYITKMLNNPRQIKLLFRASEHGYRAAAFHQHCNNIQDTLTIARTQHGKTIAGYTHYKWNQTNGKVSDPGRRSFLLQLDLQQKLVPISDKSLINCQPGYGPLFGGGLPDFGIIDNCNEINSFGYLTSSYNREGSNKYKKQQKTYNAFTGSLTAHVKYVDYEVFRVIYN